MKEVVSKKRARSSSVAEVVGPADKKVRVECLSANFELTGLKDDTTEGNFPRNTMFRVWKDLSLM